MDISETSCEEKVPALGLELKAMPEPSAAQSPFDTDVDMLPDLSLQPMTADIKLGYGDYMMVARSVTNWSQAPPPFIAVDKQFLVFDLQTFSFRAPADLKSRYVQRLLFAFVEEWEVIPHFATPIDQLQLGDALYARDSLQIGFIPVNGFARSFNPLLRSNILCFFTIF